MSGRDLVVIGASAGGVEALLELLPLLPADLRAAVFILVHRAERGAQPDHLCHVLQRRAALRVMSARDGLAFEHGHVYVTPPGSFLRIAGDVMRTHAEGLQETRPSRLGIDELFTSAARDHGERVVGVVLSGMLTDGTNGLWAIRDHGGITIAQEPATARHAAMPREALREVPLHYCLPLQAIAQTLVDLSRAAMPTARRPRVLIVEDEPLVAISLSDRLSALGYDVVGTVRTGADALSLVDACPPDVVLLDVHLADEIRGTEVGRLLWREHHIPIVYATAYADEQTLNESKRSMPYGFVVKPYRPAQIHAALQLALDRHERGQ